MFQFCGMSQHMGEILQKVFQDSGAKVSPIARKMSIDRGTIYRHFNEDTISLDYIAKYGKALGIDIKKYFPEISELASAEFIDINFEKPTYAELERTVNYWKDKYITLLEQYNELLLEKI